MTRLLVLGGSRMLGPRLIDLAVARGWEVTVANRGGEPPEGFPDGVEHVIAERGDATAMAGLARGETELIADLSCYEPEWARFTVDAFGEWTGRYLLMSSGAVYPEADVVPVNEGTEPVGRALWGDYGRKKVEIERLFRESPLAAGTIVVRPPFIVDVDDFMERLQFVFDRVMAGVPLLVPDSGKACVQLVSAADVARACVELLAAEGHDGAAFNVGPNRIVTNTSLVALSAAALGMPLPGVELVPLVEAGLTDRPYSWQDAFFPFADQHYVLDASRLDKALGGFDYEDIEVLVERVATHHQTDAINRHPAEAPSEQKVRRDRGLPGLHTTRRAHA